jgi:hypothetical protein
MLFSIQEAKEFWSSLRTVSKEILNYYNLPIDPGFKVRPWIKDHPIGITFHYTAGIKWKPTIEHLNGLSNRKSSCTLLVLDRQVVEVQNILSKYPALDRLPVLVLQLADLDTSTWHSGWSNGYCIGIENRNAGLLRGIKDKWTWWPNDWKAPFPHAELDKIPVCIKNQWWEPYTHGQIVANVILGQMLYSLYGGEMDKHWFLPHSCFSKDKLDTGKAFPLQGIRDAIFDQIAIENLVWLTTFDMKPPYTHDYIEECNDSFTGTEEAYQSSINEDKPVFLEPLFNMKLTGDKLKFASYRRFLTQLEYCIDCSDINNTSLAMALGMFQKSMGMPVNLKIDQKSTTALISRLKEFRIPLF